MVQTVALAQPDGRNLIFIIYVLAVEFSALIILHVSLLTAWSRLSKG